MRWLQPKIPANACAKQRRNDKRIGRYPAVHDAPQCVASERADGEKCVRYGVLQERNRRGKTEQLGMTAVELNASGRAAAATSANGKAANGLRSGEQTNSSRKHHNNNGALFSRLEGSPFEHVRESLLPSRASEKGYRSPRTPCRRDRRPPQGWRLKKRSSRSRRRARAPAVCGSRRRPHAANNAVNTRPNMNPPWRFAHNAVIKGVR